MKKKKKIDLKTRLWCACGDGYSRGYNHAVLNMRKSKKTPEKYTDNKKVEKEFWKWYKKGWKDGRNEL